MTLQEVLSAIHPADAAARQAALDHWSTVAHPLHSLGLLEDAVVRIAAVQGTADVRIDKRVVVAMCADNGVVAEGVTQTGQEITAMVCEGMNRGNSSVCCMARVADARVIPVDIGVAVPVEGENILQRNIRRGTSNLAVESAMTREECERAILTGVEIVRDLAQEGCKLIVTGEMGIGNTTTSAAVTAVLLGQDVEAVTGRGAGLSSEGLRRKVDAIRRGIAVNRPDPADPVDVLSKVGGLDIAGLTGVYLGGALYHVPVLIDGLISSVAALAAYRLCPAARDAMIATHASNEPAGQLVLRALELEPVVYGHLCLGEGTGAITLVPLLDMALALYREMSSFQEFNMDAYVPLT